MLELMLEKNIIQWSHLVPLDSHLELVKIYLREVDIQGPESVQ